MWNSYDTNFDAPDAHFDNLYLIDPQAEKNWKQRIASTMHSYLHYANYHKNETA
jgi:hypothetical protein